MNVSVARIVNLVASAGEAAIPVIFSRGVGEPLSGEGTAVAVIAPLSVFVRRSAGASRCFSAT